MHLPHDQSIERFAELCALLNRGFADRARVLGSAGFDEISWKEMETRWMARITASSDGELARRFGEAYAAARAPSAGSPSQVEVSTPAPRFFNREAQPWRDEAAAVPLDASGVAPPLVTFGDDDTEDAIPPMRQSPSTACDLDRTAEIVFNRSPPALPFAPSRGLEESGIRPAPASRRLDAPAPWSTTEPVDATLEISACAARGAALPFESPKSTAPRLHRFDSQTGLPLAAPYWVGGPADPTKPR